MTSNHTYSRSALLLYLAAILPAIASIFSCNESPKQSTVARADSVVIGTADTIKLEHTDSTDEDHAIYYLVIADTGKSYHTLDAKMYELSKLLKWPADTMNRHYDADKKKIVLAEDDEDEMYRGEYFPRRSPSTTLSLEYYTIYGSPSTVDNIVLLAGIFDQKASADSMQRILKPYAKNAYVLRSKVYTGCMH